MLGDDLAHGRFNHRADFHQQPTAGHQPLGGLRHQPLDHFRAARTGDQGRARLELPNVGGSLSNSASATYGGLLTMKSNCCRGDGGEQIALDELDPIGHAVIGGVLPGDGQRRRADVDGRHAACGRCLAAQTAMMPLPVPTSAMRRLESPEIVPLLRSQIEQRTTSSSVSGRGISTSGVTRKESE